MKRIYLLIILISFSVVSFAQTLKFNSKGEFKIVQFSDLHYVIHNPASLAATDCIDKIISAEKPDLVIVTGDIVYSSPSDSTLQIVLDCLSKNKTPFAITFGNHDGEADLPLSKLNAQIVKAKYSIQPAQAADGSLDYVLKIMSSDNSHPAALLYCFDSHSNAQIENTGKYAWITPDQVNWYRTQSNINIKANGGKPLPSLAFFHIPLPEYGEAITSQQSLVHGSRMEEVASPKINTGLFANMRLQGDVMGIFCGHDHDNDFSAMWYGIVLAYGRFSGGNTEYNHLPNGARVIILKEGQRAFESYVHQRNGEIVNRTVYPDSYVKK
jgi:hypothetical protein